MPTIRTHFSYQRQGRGFMLRLATVLLLGSALIASAHQQGHAQEAPSSPPIPQEIYKEIEGYLANDIVILSIKNQNQKYKDISNEEVTQLDSRWRAELDSDRKSLISATLSNPLSAYLTRIQAHSLGKFIEIFVMDDRGLNVGQSNISSDYWQGDEAKWQETYLKGPGAVHLGEAEWKDEIKSWTQQVDVAITDPATGTAIGAATFELNLTELDRRH